MGTVWAVIGASADLFMDSAPFLLLGLLVSAVIQACVSPDLVARHLGRGRFSPVLKAALLGIPLPLCSCGVVPAAVALKRRGAGNGAVLSFLISTPETGVDSIGVTYALLDPLMTVARPVSAALSAVTAGVVENLLPSPDTGLAKAYCGGACGCGDGCGEGDGYRHGPLWARIRDGFAGARREIWEESAPWFLGGIAAGGAITVLVPDGFVGMVLGGGILSMLAMLAASIPVYICASASTPIAAALIMKGASPGAVLVFLLAGPATNTASISMLVGLLGLRTTGVYLASIAVMSVVCGLALDAAYGLLGQTPAASLGGAAEAVPEAVRLASSLVVIWLSAGPVYRIFRRLFY